MAFFNSQNPYYPYQTQMQMPVQQPQPMPQPIQPQQTTLYGQMVDSLDSAKAKDIDMSGNPRYYPNINGTEIYMKQLQADGTCPVVVFKRETAPQKIIAQAQDDSMQKILEELQNIKTLMTQRGGQQNERTANNKHD